MVSMQTSPRCQISSASLAISLTLSGKRLCVSARTKMRSASPFASRRPTSYIAHDGVRRGRMTVVPLAFNECVVYQQRRALQELSLRRVACERPSVNSSEQITGLRAANYGFRDYKCNRSISVKAASGQGPDGSFCRNTNNQTDNLSSDSPIFKGSCSVLVRPHADVELLGCRIVRLSSIRVPNYSPPAARRHTCQTGHLHLEHEVTCPLRLSDGDPVDSKRSRCQSLQWLFRVARRCLLDNQAVTGIAGVWRGDFGIAA